MSSGSASRAEEHTIKEKLLLLLSRRPDSEDYAEGVDHWSTDNSLDNLCRFIPDFVSRIRNKVVLDFGCGTGFQSVRMVKEGARRVVGLDLNKAYLEKGRRLAGQEGVEDRVSFLECLDDSLLGRFDVVVSQNSMEHFPDPVGALSQMKAATKEGGSILITFGQPWFSPYGSHTQFFAKIPWVNVLFDEKTVMNVRRHFRDDGAEHYDLNQMTVAKFERIVRHSGLKVANRHYEGVKGLNFLCAVPYLRELFVNNISCVLTKV